MPPPEVRRAPISSKLGANRRLAREYEFRVGTSESLIELAAIRTMLRRITC